MTHFLFLSLSTQLNHYYEGSDSCNYHLSDRSPHLLQFTFLTFRSQPLDSPCDRLHLANVTTSQMSFRLRHTLADSPTYPAESDSLSYGLPLRIQLLSTPPHGDAVTFRYNAMAFIDKDFHLADKLPLWAHECKI